MSIKTSKYDPSRDEGIRSGGIEYANWGSSKTGMKMEKSFSLTDEQKNAYREHMSSDSYDAGELDKIGSYADDGPVSESMSRPEVRSISRNITKTRDATPVEQHKDVPPMSHQDIIRGQINNVRVREDEQPQKVLGAQLKRQKAQRTRNLALPTSVKVDRREVDINTSEMIKKGGGEILSDRDANPIAILAALNDAWGEDEWLEWEPETIEQTAQHDGLEIHPVCMDKMFALRVLKKRPDRFLSEPRIFEKVCIAFSGRTVDWGSLQEPRVHDLAATIALVDRYLLDIKGFSSDVESYVAAVALKDGYVLLPAELQFSEYVFSTQLALSAGDQVLDLQQSLLDALENGDRSDVPDEHLNQYMRLIKCQFHVQDVLSKAKS